MLAENISEELTDFDLRHFCYGRPIYCYYFRTHDTSVKTQLAENNSLAEIEMESLRATASK